MVQKCTTLIHDTLDHLQARYGSSLTKGGSGNKARDVIKRVEWCLREKDRIQALQNALREGVQRLALLSNLAARYVTHLSPFSPCTEGNKQKVCTRRQCDPASPRRPGTANMSRQPPSTPTIAGRTETQSCRSLQRAE